MKTTLKVLTIALSAIVLADAETINESLAVYGHIDVNTNNDAALTFNNTDNSWQYIQFKQSSVRKTWMGLDNYNNFCITKENGGNLSLLGSNVGIGTTAPGSELEVFAAGQESAIWIDADANQQAALYFQSAGSYRTGFYRPAGSDDLVMWGNEAGDFLTFKNDSDGRVGIGTTAPSHKLSVNGAIRAKEVIVDTGWSDFVFEDGYNLLALSEVENHIETHGHLPDIPPTAQVESEGLSVGEAQKIMMQKIEELTLYTIAQQKELNEYRSKVLELEAKFSRLDSPEPATP